MSEERLLELMSRSISTLNYLSKKAPELFTRYDIEKIEESIKRIEETK